MKTALYNVKGEKTKDVELPKIFESPIRKDITAKYFEADKFMHPYSPDPRAGRKHSASGTISHQRHDWKGHYGKGISRAPRKTMWRRGTQFMWVGAEVSGARGGRRAHGPKGIGKEKRINKKEMMTALRSAFAATGKDSFIISRYGSLGKLDVKVPVVVESSFANQKSKDVLAMLRKIFGNTFRIVLQKKSVRAGKGKGRNRRYKSNAGLLFIVAGDENIKMKGIEIKPVRKVRIEDLYPLGRIVVYSEKALGELSKLGGKNAS